jgi:phage terminase large subunit-like protein
MTCSHVERYLTMIESGEVESCKDQKALAAYVRKCFATEDIYTDNDQLEKYLGLSKYFPFDKVFEWEEFCIALHLCTFWKDTGQPRWPDLFLLIGRGAGKDGFIALESLCLVSPYNPILKYDVDICATAEEQAMRPVNDLLDVLESTKHRKKLKKHFYWTKLKIVGLKYRGTIKGRTNNPKSKDGMRSGMVAFNEVHQYENYKNIKVFVTSLGKVAHPRRLYATSNGDIRQGPLDDLLTRSEQILKGEIGDNGLLPFVCRLDSKDEVDNPDMWIKANPSLPYLPDLQAIIEKEYVDWKENPIANADFMTKRMNLPQSDSEVVVTDWDNIAATNRPLPDLTGWACTCGIDYASVDDFASVNLHFRKGDIRYWINHSWLCLQSKDLHRLTIPYREWAEQGLITLVDDVEIHPDLLCEWILKQGQKYQIKQVALDNFRYALFTNSLKNIGFDANDKNVKLVRPSDIMKVQPVINSMFVNHNLIAGDNPPLRWAINNTKLLRNTSGSFYYGKIEEKSRKTDPFLAGVASMVIEDILGTGESVFEDLPVIIG